MARWRVLALALCALSTAATVPAAEQRFGSRYPSARHGGHYMYSYYVPPAPSSTPWAPSWSPDGRWIAVAMSGSIWKVDPASGQAHELTHGPAYHSSPDWSPDGEWIIYTADDGGETIQLEALEVATGETRPLTGDGFLYLDPVFSPDGERAAYVSARPNGYFNVWIRPIRRGRWTGPETAVTRDNNFGRERLYFGPWDMHLTPAWLPGGEELLILSNRHVPLGSGNLLRVPAAPGGIDQARTVLAEQTLYRTRPHVSADGKRFIYSSTRGAGDQFSNLYLQPTAGGEPYKLTFFNHDAFHPRWSPDGEWIAYISNEGGLPQLALLETHGGSQRTVHITDRRWRRTMGVLSVRTLAPDTSQTPARIHLKASDGKFYAPGDAYARVSFAGEPYFHAGGAFRLAVPAGKLTIEAVKGFEFRPERKEVDIRPDEVTEVTLRLERMDDLSARGWYSGSTHVHLNYGGNLRNTLENLLLMSEAEDQDIVNEQVANKDNRVLDHHLFVKGGGPHPLSRPDRLLVVGQEYRPPFYGHVSFFGLKDHLLSPYTTGYEGTAIESLYPSNTDMLRKAKAQGATVGYVHAFKGEGDPLVAEDLGQAKGYVVDAALGATDTIEWSESSRATFFPWYATLNCGLRVAAAGGEDSITSLHYSKVVGSFRTYVHTGARGLDMGAWFQGLREGRSFVTNGPLLELTINGALPGEEVRLPAGGAEVQIALLVRSIVPLAQVLLVSNGRVVETFRLETDRRNLEVRKPLKVTRTGWYHLRAEGNAGEQHPLDAIYAQAFTNPIWVTVGDQPVRSQAAADYCLRWIDALEALAKAWPGWRSQKERDHVFAQFEEARRVYRRRAAEAAPPATEDR